MRISRIRAYELLEGAARRSAFGAADTRDRAFDPSRSSVNDGEDRPYPRPHYPSLGREPQERGSQYRRPWRDADDEPYNPERRSFGVTRRSDRSGPQQSGIPDQLRELYLDAPRNVPGATQKKNFAYPPLQVAERKRRREAFRKPEGSPEEYRQSRTARQITYAQEPDLVPVTLPPREKLVGPVDYTSGKGGQSHEMMAFLNQDIEREVGQTVELDSMEEAEEVNARLEAGRVVECRRSGQTSVGLILSPVIVAGKARYLVLGATGEIWPISSHDVQFIMPASLVPSELGQKCWHPRFLSFWLAGTVPSEADTPEVMEEWNGMLEARRQAVLTLRRIVRESEKMTQRIMSDASGNGPGGIEVIWEKWAPRDDEARGSVTSAEAANAIVNHSTESPIAIRPNTLPALAAHMLMMRRFDLFVADGEDMWDSGRFMVRSRAEKRRYDAVLQLLKSNTDEEKRNLSSFSHKAQAVIELSRKMRESPDDKPRIIEYKHSLPEWSSSDREIIHAILLRLYERRSTQVSGTEPVITSIIRDVDRYGEQMLDLTLIAQLMLDIGVIDPWNTLRSSIATEDVRREHAMAGNPRGEGELLRGNELDDIREDFSSHRVFVIDEATAAELDDGVALERIHDSQDVWVHVHIADPTRYLHQAHPLAIQASCKGSSLYLPEGDIPMLPLDIMMKELSLGAEGGSDDGRQAVMTFSARLDMSGGMQDYRVAVGWIKKPRLVTYAEVNEILGFLDGEATRPAGTPINHQSQKQRASSVNAAETDDLNVLHELAKSVKRQRYSTAGFDIAPLPSNSVRLLTKLPSSPDNVFDIHQLPERPRLWTGSVALDFTVKTPPDVDLSSSMMVAEYMVLAGRVAARFCHERGLPIPFRGSSPAMSVSRPGVVSCSVEDFLVRRNDLGVLDQFTLRNSGLSQSAGSTSTKPLQHWTIGFDKPDLGYTRATSPLRRFDDLIVHWQIKSALASEKGLSPSISPRLSDQEVETLFRRSNVAQKRNKRLTSYSSTWWTAGLLAFKLGRDVPPLFAAPQLEGGHDFRTHVMDAIIARPGDNGLEKGRMVVPCFLPELGCEGFIDDEIMVGRNRSIGEIVKVRLQGAQQWPLPVFNVRAVE